MNIFDGVKRTLMNNLKLSFPKVKQLGMTKRDIKKVINKYKRMSEKEEKYLVLATSWAEDVLLNITDDLEREMLFNMYKENDDRGFIPLKEGQFLEYLTTFASLGIHYIKYPLIKDDITNDAILKSIFTDGLKNMGDLSSGVKPTKDIEPSKTIYPINTPFDIVFRLKSQYKESNGAVLIAFKQGIVNENFDFIDSSNEEILNEIYDYDVVPHIRPIHLLNYVYIENGHCEFYEKSLFAENKKVNKI